MMNPDEILSNGDLTLQEFNQDDFQEIEAPLFAFTSGRINLTMNSLRSK